MATLVAVMVYWIRSKPCMDSLAVHSYDAGLAGRTNQEALSLLTAKEIRIHSTKNLHYSLFKTIAYFFAIAFFAYIYAISHDALVALVVIVGMGVVFAHGLELQHEALHGNLFQSARANRVLGFLFGLPMLVSYTHYRSYHFHHHRAVGSKHDEELVNYSLAALHSVPNLICRAWNINRIPTFIQIFVSLAKGTCPVRVKIEDQRRLWFEYCAILAAVSLCFAAAIYFQTWTIVVIWVLPWLLVAEPLHFLIELPEHLGCEQFDASILRNTRSYPSGWLWGYLINHNNLHIEHHLFPTVPAHKLIVLSSAIQSAGGHCSVGYFAAITEIRAAARAAQQSS